MKTIKELKEDLALAITDNYYHLSQAYYHSKAAEIINKQIEELQKE